LIIISEISGSSGAADPFETLNTGPELRANGGTASPAEYGAEFAA
jgi:hypothetical protein